MSGKSTSKPSRTDWSRVSALRDQDIKLSRTHPEADPSHIVRGIVRKGLKPFSPKQAISLRVDPDVLEWFKAQGSGWQTRMNSVLMAYKEAASQSLVLTTTGSRRKRVKRAA
ncbi:MAG: BrnA antitoxin family protein [Gammaproteobacteria bacterium]